MQPKGDSVDWGTWKTQKDWESSYIKGSGRI